MARTVRRRLLPIGVKVCPSLSYLTQDAARIKSPHLNYASGGTASLQRHINT
jgi:hypothetical protein